MGARHTSTRQHADQTESAWLPRDLGGQEVIGHLYMRLRSGPEAAGEGRHALDRLDGSMDAEQLGELRLLISELVTNSIRHAADGDGWITLDVDVNADAVRVVVTDRGGGFDPDPKPRAHVDRPGGWGLCLVDRLADRWGVRDGDATSVWFEVDRAFAAA